MAECGSEGARWWAIESADLRYLKTDGVKYEEEPGTCGQRRRVVVKDKLRKTKRRGVKEGVKVWKECGEELSDSDGSGSVRCSRFTC